MKLMGVALALALGSSALRADLSPEAFQSVPLSSAGGNSGWYFFPDNEARPRVLAKTTTATNASSRKLLTDGPPAWTTGSAVSLNGINKQGVFVPAPGGGGYLVAPHNGSVLKVAIFDNNGAASVETIDDIVGTYTGISAALDPSGKLHVGYVWGGDNICYARRDGIDTWEVAITADTNLPLHQTAVIPASSSDVGLYFTMTYQGVGTLWRAKPVTVGGVLVVVHAASSPLVNLENDVAAQLRGARVVGTDRLFYFGRDGGSTWKFRVLSGGAASTVQTFTSTLAPRSIHFATASDGKQRVAWYDSTAKKVRYYKPSTIADGPPYTAAEPIVLTGTGWGQADLAGLHFDEGVPYLLYSQNDTSAFIAFPNDNFDFNKNGRLDILDNAFNSTTAGLEALPVVPAEAGVANSADRLKFRFPTIGSATSNGLSAVTTTQENLRYGFELSPDGVTWTPATTAGVINFTQTAATGTNPNQVRTMVGVVNTAAPGALSKRFARMVVTRPTYPY